MSQEAAELIEAYLKTGKTKAILANELDVPWEEVVAWQSERSDPTEEQLQNLRRLAHAA